MKKEIHLLELALHLLWPGPGQVRQVRQVRHAQHQDKKKIGLGRKRIKGQTLNELVT